MLFLYRGFKFIFNRFDFYFGKLYREKSNLGYYWLVFWIVFIGYGNIEERDEVFGYFFLLKMFVFED